MQKLQKISIGVSYIILLFSACTNLNEVIYSSVTEENFNYEATLGPAIAGVYSDIRLITDYPTNFSAQENSADIIVMPANSTGWDNGGQYKRMHHHRWTSEQTQLDGMWTTFYRGVTQCNTTIEQLEEGVIPVTEAEKTAGIYEVRAVRAFYYWYLCDCFGDIPLVTSTAMQLPSKSSRKEVYSFIEQELIDIIPHLSEETGGKYYGRMNRWAAQALLANLYLNAEIYTGTAQWQKCITQCDDIINSQRFELDSDYKNLFRSAGMENNKEIIFTIPFDYQYGAHGNRLHVASWHANLKYRYTLKNDPYGSGCIKGIPQFIDTYDKDDTRLEDTWMMGQQYKPNGEEIWCAFDMAPSLLIFTNEMPDGDYTNEKEGYRMNKYEVAMDSYANSDTDIPVFRYAEILMMKAECLLRSNQSGAGALVTAVRQRAFKEKPNLAIVTDEQLKENSSYQYGYVENYEVVDKGNQDKIEFGRMYDELGWEFAWEVHRRRDAIRFGVYTTKSWLSHKPNGAYRSIFPIPERQLGANPKLEQNPDYVY